MIQPSGDRNLAQEPLGAERLGQLGTQDLDSSLALVLQIVSEVDRGHAALTQLAIDAVSPDERGAQKRQGVFHERSK